MSLVTNTNQSSSAERAFQPGVVKNQTKSQGALTNTTKKQNKNLVVKITKDVFVNKVFPFLTEDERTNFQKACIGDCSLTASRFDRLNKLSQAILQNPSKIPVQFQELHKDDRTRILTKFGKEKFDWNQMKELREPLLKEVEAMKAEHSFTILSSKSVNYLKKLPIALMSDPLSSFLIEKERADFRNNCRNTRKIQTPISSIIKTYKLEGLIETYLHVSSSDLTKRNQKDQSYKAKTLHKLMSLAHSLSEIEKLPCPTYSSLSAFFQEVEARNLIRMIGAIRDASPLPNLPAGVEDLQIPNDPTATIQKANRLRDWINQGAIAAIGSTLDLTNKDLSLLPKEIGQLQTLQALDLKGNRLVSLPKEIGQLKALQELRLGNNRLVSIPKEIGQLKALRWFDLKNNHLVSIPKEIGRLKALQWLRLSNNRLASVPKGIGQLKTLQGLYLENNRLVSVPEEIGQIKTLERLHLENNRLVSVPKEIGQLKALRSLELENNGMIWMPPELDRFKGALGKQNKNLQVKNYLDQLSLCVTGQHNTKRIAGFLDAMDRRLGKEARGQLHRCLYEVAQKAAKTDETLREKLKDKHFGRKAFLDESIDPKLKAAAIAKFRKTLEE